MSGFQRGLPSSSNLHRPDVRRKNWLAKMTGHKRRKAAQKSEAEKHKAEMEALIDKHKAEHRPEPAPKTKEGFISRAKTKLRSALRWG